MVPRFIRKCMLFNESFDSARAVFPMLLFFLSVLPFTLTAQQMPEFNGVITGRLVGTVQADPIEYANVLLFLQSNDKQLTGTITDAQGYFRLDKLRPGKYYIEISFMGFQTKQIRDIEILNSAPEVVIGNILLEQKPIEVEGVSAVAERPALEYLIDKKVINVAKQMTAISGTAVDVLENVPSVTVDIEGNVSLRGSGNFTVLIDNRPTVLDPSDVLQQIPASTIETIEIITNPSAKYDPDGMAGIINIILKKKSLEGISGIANSNIGLNNKYGGDVLLNYRRSFYSAYISLNYNNWQFSGQREAENRTYNEDTTSYVLSQGESNFSHNPLGFRTGLDLDLGVKDRLTIGGQYRKHSMNRNSFNTYDEWTDPGNIHNEYVGADTTEHSHEFYSLMFDYIHHFLPKDHDFSAQINFNRSQGSEESINICSDTNNIITGGQRDTESGPGTRIRVKTDYALPLGKTSKIEAGYQSRLNRSEESNELYEYDTISHSFIFKPEYSHTTSYDRGIHSLYGLYSGKAGKFGYQLGLRGEYENRTIELVGENSVFSIDRLDYFPTAHVSYQFPGDHQLMASYARRIERTREWWLEPFLTWMDANNVRQGNPDLKPENIDSYETGFQTLRGKSSFSIEAYHRVTHNKVEQTSSLYADDVILRTVENIGTDYSTGVELMMDLKFIKWWNQNFMFNLYDYRIRGELYGETVAREDVNWGLRLNNEFKPFKNTKIQLNGRYRSPSITAQGERSGFFMTDAAIKQEFFKRRLTATLQVRDILGSGAHENTIESSDFYSHSNFTREAPVFMLNISYNFNNYKPERRQDNDQIEVESIEEY